MNTNSPELNNSFAFLEDEESIYRSQTTKMLEFLSVAKEIVDFNLTAKELKLASEQ
jgi:hypothetical protein